MPESRRGQSGMGIRRRQFLFQMAGAGVGMPLIDSHATAALEHLVPVVVDNPLSNYPNRDWEKAYRDLYRSDSKCTFLCAPNDTHNCLLYGHVRNGFYGDRRCKRPMVRHGFKKWIDDGMPRNANGEIDRTYTQRGIDGWTAISWDEAFDMSAKVLANIAETYSGEEGKRTLLAQGYDELIVEATEGAGTQTLKFRGGMPALGATPIFAHHRLANGLTLLDSKIRGTGPSDAIAARN